MPRFITAGILILNLAMFSPCSATQVISGTVVVQQGNSTKTGASAYSSSSVERVVVNIVLDRIEDGVIYSKDSQTFQLPGSAKVIDNSHPVTKMRTAELVFENGSLVMVNIK